MTKDWYSPGEIHFTRDTALWLIRNIAYIKREVEWPPEASSYIDNFINKSSSHKAPFITPIEAVAEITDRLEKCGLDGLILLAIEGWGESESSMAAYFRKPEWTIRKRYKQALRYVASGPARRWHTTKKRQGETYDDFKLSSKK